jgi:hypothetical protein
MRSEMLISTPEATTASARASKQACVYSAAKWFDVTTGIRHAGFNADLNPATGPGGTS